MKKEALKQLQEIPKEKIICFDCETTGLDSRNDEIVQLSIIDGNEKVLFNELIKPKNHTQWKEAERIHNITPEAVKDLPIFKEHIPKIKQIFENAALLVTYNGGFDTSFLYYNSDGEIDLHDKKVFDVMFYFAEIYGEWNDYFNSYKWQKLTTCAAYYDYNFENAHNSLYDVKATLYCYYKILNELINE